MPSFVDYARDSNITVKQIQQTCSFRTNSIFIDKFNDCVKETKIKKPREKFGHNDSSVWSSSVMSSEGMKYPCDGAVIISDEEDFEFSNENNSQDIK